MILAFAHRICQGTAKNFAPQLKGKRLLVLFLLPGILLLSACSFTAKKAPDSRPTTASEPATDAGHKSAGAPPRKYPAPTETDLLLDAKPHTLPEVKSAAVEPAIGADASKEKSTRGPWRIQVAALADLEAAQARKRELDTKLGGTVDLIFDAPYYKLRWGAFASKQEAEDKLLEMSEVIREGFVIRQ